MNPVTNQSAPEAKIALFRSLFRGREDVYPRRFESQRTGRTGYAPACANEWVRGICEKPRIKCAHCQNRRFLEVTDEVIRWHLTGRDREGNPFVMGVYPMLSDETCQFLAVDFDGETWMEDARAYLKTCQDLELPAALERSRSGNGGHVWLFFEESLSAALARKLGSLILTKTMENRPDIRFSSYDRFFPNQDTLPKGGFGNLIALPLQYEPRKSGYSAFVDEDFHVIEDQWKFLSELERISLSRAEQLVEEATRKGGVLGVRTVGSEEGTVTPWERPPSRRMKREKVTGPFPGKLEIVLGDQVYIPKTELSPPLRNRLIRLAAFPNLEFYRAQAMRLPTYDKPRIIACAEDVGDHVGLPRGCLGEVATLLRGLGIEVIMRDERNPGRRLDVTFQGTLRPEQVPAAEALLGEDTGVLAATTAFGKTVVAAWLIAQRGVNALILVHRRQLMEQWVERLSSFLDIPAKRIGRYGGGRKKLTGALDVALLQSLVSKGVVDDRLADYGHIIVDECHHLPARSFELAVSRAKARYVTGLSATVTRKDGHHPIIFMQCGPARYRVDAKQQAAARPFTHEVIVRPTGFRAVGSPEPDRRIEFQNLYDQLMEDEKRNRLIGRDVRAALEAGRSPLVLTERTQHLLALESILQGEGLDVVCLRGGMSRRALRAALDKLSTSNGSERGRVILATGRFVGEGFDDARLDTLFLTLPVSWSGIVAQYVGRLHRLHESKRDVRVYDYADLDVPMLSRMFDRRCCGYEAVGYTILLPASALPGWPVEVALPVDPAWKREYGASVRRLILDGVDQPLAEIFVHVAPWHPPDGEGVERARSASEAFLFRRLQSLGSTKNRFELNRSLPIPFGGMGKMEVDLVDIEHRIVIEIDGSQHLADPDAYRRDRRKDALLQQHGYYILRFLAEDIGTRLDQVLDDILRALAQSERSCG